MRPTGAGKGDEENYRDVIGRSRGRGKEGRLVLETPLLCGDRRGLLSFLGVDSLLMKRDRCHRPSYALKTILKVDWCFDLSSDLKDVDET